MNIIYMFVCVCEEIEREQENRGEDEQKSKRYGKKRKKLQRQKKRSDSAVFRHLTMDNSALGELRAAGPHPRPALSKRYNMRYMHIYI